jgi:hypothetical protein
MGRGRHGDERPERLPAAPFSAGESLRGIAKENIQITRPDQTRVELPQHQSDYGQDYSIKTFFHCQWDVKEIVFTRSRK